MYKDLKEFISQIKEEQFVPTFKYAVSYKWCKERNDIPEHKEINIVVVLGISRDLKRIARYEINKSIYDDSYEWYSNNPLLLDQETSSRNGYIETITEENDLFYGSLMGFDYEDYEDNLVSISDIDSVTWEKQKEMIIESIKRRWSGDLEIKNAVKSIFNCIDGLSYDAGLSIIKNFMKTATKKRLSYAPICFYEVKKAYMKPMRIGSVDFDEATIETSSESLTFRGEIPALKIKGNRCIYKINFKLDEWYPISNFRETPFEKIKNAGHWIIKIGKVKYGDFTSEVK